MKENSLKDDTEATPVASAKEIKDQKTPKAKRIVVGTDVHLRSYQAARKIDNGAIGAVQNFRSEAEVLLYVDKQCEQAEEVVVVYEAGPLGYGLYRKLRARGVRCLVCAPDSSQQRRKRRKNNQIDARTLTGQLFNYLNGNEGALQLARVPTEEQEQGRLASRQHDQLVEERKRLAAKGNALLLSQGFGSCKNWWRPKAFSRLQQLLPAWLFEMLQTWVDLLRALDEKIQAAKAALAKRYSGPRPKGAGANSLVQLQSEVLDWGLYRNRRKIACLAGMVRERVEYRRESTPGLHYQSGSAGHSPDYHRDGLADHPVPAAIPAGAKMAGTLGGHERDAEEKSGGRHWPAADGRSVAAADRTGHRARTQPGHDRWLSILEVPRKLSGIKLGLCPKPRFGGNS
jgi:transposase